MLHELAVAQKVNIKQTFCSWCSLYTLLIIIANAIVITWALASHNKQQVLMKAKAYVYIFWAIVHSKQQVLVKANAYVYVLEQLLGYD